MDPNNGIRDDGRAQRGRTPQLLPIPAAASAYRLVYKRIDALLRGRADVAPLPVPACPAWTVRQTVAHLTGVAHDIVSLNLENKAADSWTQAQVDRLDGHSIDELLDQWQQAIDSVTSTLTMAPEASACQLVFDTLTHEHDIRGALGEPGSRTGDLAFNAALAFVTAMGDQFIRQGKLPALLLTTPAVGTVQLGQPHTAHGQIALDISDFEALRSFGGRRSLRQLSQLPWDGDPTHLFPAFTHLLPAFSNDGLRPPTDDLIE
ncbi:maleylpyruvate isomerase family mycothiol-dependent enzyme [Mycobacterium sp. DL440]|uniref:maleylpyruvate isomerase family mycothiol-dependent enzyme n=1 Tax=Mycobacterium sp. DL440 TaxID=2675523 RepID=UPI001420810B|nr:maleylpyruvate isomerase family mycothiol-dependent enzyme [Mycobacterium sp. DL440]